MTDRGPVSTLEGVTVLYGATHALEDVSVSFASGAVGLLGPNGAGKSSMLKALLGFVVQVGVDRTGILGAGQVDDIVMWQWWCGRVTRHHAAAVGHTGKTRRYRLTVITGSRSDLDWLATGN